MRVAMYYKNNDLRVADMPVPKIGPGEILMHVEASGICGTDVLEWYRLHKAPLVLGHEVAGVIAEVGEGVDKYKKGGRIFVSHHVPCNNCHYCLSGHHTVCEMLRKTNFDPGGFSEYIRIPKINLETGTLTLPDNVSFDEATFIEPLGCCIRGQRQAMMRPGKSVLVIGSGISGILHIQLARLAGAGNIITTDISDYRVNAAKRFGANSSFLAKDYSPDKLRKVNEGRLADLVILCAGADSAIKQALESIERGGTLLIFAAAGKDAGLPLPINDIFWRNEVTLASSYGASPADCAQALDLIAEHKLNLEDMITHRLRLDDIGLGFKLVAQGNESIKVIIKP